jgi:hypothetical protein
MGGRIACLVVNGFASLLEFVVARYSDDGLIDFGAPATAAAVVDSGPGPNRSELLH